MPRKEREKKYDPRSRIFVDRRENFSKKKNVGKERKKGKKNANTHRMS